MSQTLKKYWQVFWKFRQIHFMRTLEYRGDFIFWTLISLAWTLFNLFFYHLLTTISPNIAGWSRWEILLVIAVFNLIDTFTWSVFYHNMREYSRLVFSGELNQFLTKPLDIQFLLMTQSNSFNNILRFVVGVWLLLTALHQLNYHPSWSQVIAFVLSLGLSLCLVYFLWFTLATSSFWVEKLENINEIIPNLRQIWEVPRSVYVGLTSFFLTIVFPLGLITSIPSEIILGKSSSRWVAYFVAVTVVSFIVSRLFFRLSIKKYSGVGN